MIGIIDYGMGNLRSVQKACHVAGLAAELTSDPGELENERFSALILPGVGAFEQAMANLRQIGMDRALGQWVQQGRPFLGICLGLQLLFGESEESSSPEPVAGLNLVPGRVRRFPAGLKVPQIGWNRIHFSSQEPLFSGLPSPIYVYFVHSYYVEPSDEIVAMTKTSYGVEFVSGIRRRNVYGIQFHPEKSSRCGLQILKNFGDIVHDYYSSN